MSGHIGNWQGLYVLRGQKGIGGIGGVSRGIRRCSSVRVYWGAGRDSRYSGARRGIGASCSIGGSGRCRRAALGHQGL